MYNFIKMNFVQRRVSWERIGLNKSWQLVCTRDSWICVIKLRECNVAAVRACICIAQVSTMHGRQAMQHFHESFNILVNYVSLYIHIYIIFLQYSSFSFTLFHFSRLLILPDLPSHCSAYDLTIFIQIMVRVRLVSISVFANF